MRRMDERKEVELETPAVRRTVVTRAITPEEFRQKPDTPADVDEYITGVLDLDFNPRNRPPDFWRSCSWFPFSVEANNLEALLDFATFRPLTMTDTGYFSELQQLERLENHIHKWASGWGGVAHWHLVMEQSFSVAVEEHREEDWVEQLLEHAVVGRRLLGTLHHVNDRLPSEPWKVREIWRRQVVLVEMLVRGITTIEIQVSILPTLCLARYSPPETEPEAGDGDDDAMGEDVDS